MMDGNPSAVCKIKCAPCTILLTNLTSTHEPSYKSCGLVDDLARPNFHRAEISCVKEVNDTTAHGQ